MMMWKCFFNFTDWITVFLILSRKSSILVFPNIQFIFWWWPRSQFSISVSSRSPLDVWWSSDLLRHLDWADTRKMLPTSAVAVQRRLSHGVEPSWRLRRMWYVNDGRCRGNCLSFQVRQGSTRASSVGFLAWYSSTGWIDECRNDGSRVVETGYTDGTNGHGITATSKNTNWSFEVASAERKTGHRWEMGPPISLCDPQTPHFALWPFVLNRKV